MAESSRRVVITGLGAVTPIGNTVSAYWAGLKSGANGVAPITLFDASRHACRFAAEVKEFDPSGVLDPKETKRWDRFCQFGVVAAKEALAHSGLEITDATRGKTDLIREDLDINANAVIGTKLTVAEYVVDMTAYDWGATKDYVKANPLPDIQN